MVIPPCELCVLEWRPANFGRILINSGVKVGFVDCVNSRPPTQKKNTYQHHGEDTSNEGIRKTRQNFRTRTPFQEGYDFACKTVQGQSLTLFPPQVEVGHGKKAIIVFVPVPLLGNFHKIQQR
jgi:hypothetical protein